MRQTEHPLVESEQHARKSIEERILENPETHEQKSLEDAAFREVAINAIVDRFLIEMRESGMSQEALDEIALRIDDIADRELATTALCIPYEGRSALFRSYVEKGDSPNEIVADLIDRARKVKDEVGTPILGFHTTSKKIPRKPVVGPDGKEHMSWIVNGIEKSDWGGDVPLAYAARRYRDLYRERKADNIYIVRDWEANEIDPSTGWSRSPSFAVIAAMELEETDERIREAVRRAQEKTAD